MIKESWIRYLTDFQISSYKSGNISKEETIIVEKLMSLPANKTRFEEFKVVQSDSINLEEGIERLKELAQKGEKLVLNKKETNVELRAGQIWKLKRVPLLPSVDKILPYAQDTFVMLMSKPFPYVSDYVEEDISKEIHEAYLLNAVLISFDTHFAIENDVIFRDNNDYLGISFMVQTELEFHIIQTNLDYFVCELNHEDKMKVLEVYLKANGFDYNEEITSSVDVGKNIESKEDYEYLYKMIQMDNSKLLSEPVLFLDELLKVDFDLTVLINEDYQVFDKQAATDVFSISNSKSFDQSDKKLFENSICTLNIKRDNDNRILFGIISEKSIDVRIELVDIFNNVIWKSENKQVKMNRTEDILLTKRIHDKLVYLQFYLNGNLEAKINVKF